MRKINTDSYKNKIAQKEPVKRYWGNISVEVFVPKSIDIPEDGMRQKAEEIIQQAGQSIDNLPLDIQVNETNIIGNDNDIETF